jgi:hypothetical protein
MFGAFGRGVVASIFAISGFVAVCSTPVRAASCNLSTCVFTQGTFTGGVTENPTGLLNYIIPAAVGGTFTTSPIAFEWGFSRPNNPTPQDAASVKAFAEAWLGVTLTDVVEQVNTLPSSTGFTATTAANVFMVHIGNGELVFLFNTAVALTMTNWTGSGLSNLRSFNIACTENCASRINPPAVPLPAALPLFASGSAVIGFLAWRRKKRRP